MASNAAVGFGTFNLKKFIKSSNYNFNIKIGSFLAIITPNIDSTVGLIGPVFFPLLLFSGKCYNIIQPIFFCLFII